MREFKRNPRRNYYLLQEYMEMLESDKFCDFYESHVVDFLARN